MLLSLIQSAVYISLLALHKQGNAIAALNGNGCQLDL